MPDSFYIRATWKSQHKIEVPEGRDPDEYFDSLEWMDEVNTGGADLTDWERA